MNERAIVGVTLAGVLLVGMLGFAAMTRDPSGELAPGHYIDVRDGRCQLQIVELGQAARIVTFASCDPGDEASLTSPIRMKSAACGTVVLNRFDNTVSTDRYLCSEGCWPLSVSTECPLPLSDRDVVWTRLR